MLLTWGAEDKIGEKDRWFRVFLFSVSPLLSPAGWTFQTADISWEWIPRSCFPCLIQ